MCVRCNDPKQISVSAAIVRGVRGEEYGMETLVIDGKAQAHFGQYIRAGSSLGGQGHPTGHFPEPLVGTAQFHGLPRAFFDHYCTLNSDAHMPREFR